MSEETPGTRRDEHDSRAPERAAAGSPALASDEDLKAAAEAHGSHAGRPGSWLAVTIMVAGFIVGAVALAVGPTWVAFWTGVGIVVLGFIVGGLVRIFSDVVVDAPREIPEIVDYSVFGSRTTKRRGGTSGETLDKPVHTDTQHTPHG